MHITLPYQILANLASPGNRRARLGILIYHRVLSSRDWARPFEPTIQDFDWQMSLAKRVFNVLPLSEAADRLFSGSLPKRALCITFDDGYADNFRNAVPVLRRYALPATFFIATGYDDKRSMWNDILIDSIRQTRASKIDLSTFNLPSLPIATREQRLHAIAQLLPEIKYRDPQERDSISRRAASLLRTSPTENLMMTSNELRAMFVQGMTLGAHTVNHPILARTPLPDAEVEIRRSKEVLEECLDERITLFAYPNGKPGIDYTKQHSDLVRELGFQLAVSTAWGAAGMISDGFQLPRFTPWDNSPGRFSLRLCRNYRCNGQTANQ